MAVPIIERRFLPQTEARAAADGKGFTGYAAVFNQVTQIGDPKWGFKEVVSKGAFTKTLMEMDVVALSDHDMAKPLSRTSAKTLRLTQDDHGLAVDSDIPDTSYGNDLRVNLDVGNVKGMSFGFRVTKDDWEILEDGSELRTIREVQLFEVSTTAFPAYEGTEAALRSSELRSVALARQARRSRRDADTTDDDDPGALASGVDAAIDEAIDLFATVDTTELPEAVAQGIALIQAADSTVDHLLAVLGVPDPDQGDDDDADDGRSRHEPGMTTRDTTDATEPADATRVDIDARRRRLRALSAVHGLPLPATGTDPKE